MRRHRVPAAFLALAVLVAGLVFAFVATTADGPDPDACRDALRQQYVAMRVGTPYQQGRPAACEGFDQPTLYQLLSEAVAQAEGGSRDGR